jgi:predicted SnoaL-like aldol condensation-catalyzing enzyme
MTLPRRAAFATLAFLLAGPGAQAQTPLARAPALGRDLAQEERNRRLVVEFYEGVFIRRDLSVAERLLAEDYIQHNPMVPTGRTAFIAVFGRVLAANPQRSSRIVRSAAEGDLVWLHVHSIPAPGARGSAIVDIFRVADGLIAEHWDVVQPVPENAANSNTMF